MALIPIVLSTEYWKVIIKEFLQTEVALSKSDAEIYRAIINLILDGTGLKEADILKEVEDEYAQ